MNIFHKYRYEIFLNKQKTGAIYEMASCVRVMVVIILEMNF